MRGISVPCGRTVDTDLGHAKLFRACENAEMPSHFPDVPDLDLLEFRKRRVNIIVIRDYSAVIG